MSQWINTYLFGIYPYICLSVFLIGSLIRFDREQYGWRSQSSQVARSGLARMSSKVSPRCAGRAPVATA